MYLFIINNMYSYTVILFNTEHTVVDLGKFSPVFLLLLLLLLL